MKSRQPLRMIWLGMAFQLTIVFSMFTWATIELLKLNGFIFWIGIFTLLFNIGSSLFLFMIYAALMKKDLDEFGKS